MAAVQVHEPRLVAAWGPDSSQYAGKSLTLYRDPKVKWGGMEIGGIRVSHMSHIDREMLLQLTATKGKRAPHVVKPLEAPPATFSRSPNEEASKEQVALHQRTETWAQKYIAAVQDAVTDDELKGIRARQADKLAWVRDNYREIYDRVIASDPHSAIASDQLRPAEPQAGDNTSAETAAAEVTDGVA
jgi:hypothetical protein